jgi:plastocyanin domain-containing protein
MKLWVLTAAVAALALAACDNKPKTDATVTTGAAPVPAAVPPGARAIAITADDHGFTPGSVDVKKGEHATLVFTRTTDDTCAKDVVFPELKITKPLPLKQPVTFDVPSGDARTLTFQCGMGMFKGKVVIQ